MSFTHGGGGGLTRARPEDDDLLEPSEEYGPSSFGGFADYMRRKRKKLQNKDAEIRATAQDKPQIFRGIVAHVNGYTQPSQTDLNHMIVAHGGRFMPVLNQKTAVTHIIASSLTPKKREESRKYRVVKPSWVTESIKAGKLLPWHQFSLLEHGSGQKLLSVAAQGGSTTTVINAPSSAKKNPFREQSDASWYTVELNASPRKPSFRLFQKNSLIPPSPVEGSENKDSSGNPGDEIESDESPPPSQLPPPPGMPQSPTALGIEQEPLSAHQRPSTPAVSLTVSGQTPARAESASETRTPNSVDQQTLPKIHKRALNSKDPNFIQQFYQESRLHHLSTWKAQLKAQMQTRANEHSSSYATALKKKPTGQRRYILHVDFDSFFAAVAMQKSPDLKDKPVAVAHGAGPGAEIASCNYPAREFGVKNGMWMKGAQELCKNLIVVPYDFSGYEEASKKFYDVILGLDGIVQSVSIDEALVDISALVLSSVGSSGVGVSEGSIYREQAKADEIAKQLRDEIRAKTACEVSVGIGGNILQAKVALKKAKPAGQFQLKPGDVMELIGNLVVQDLPGVAHSMGAKLEELGVKLVRDLRCLTRERLCRALGPKTGEKLFMYARGIDTTEVGQETARKSISAEINWGIRFETRIDAEDFIYKLCEELHRRCVEHQSRGSQFTMRIMRRAPGAPMEPVKHMGHGVCDTFNRSIRLGVPTNDVSILAREACQVLRSFNFDPKDIRGLGVQLTKLVPSKHPSCQQGQTGQRSLAFLRKQSTTPTAAPVTPTKPVKYQDIAIDPDEIESPRKEDTPANILPERRPGLIDPAMKRLNVTGNQFIMPPLETEREGIKKPNESPAGFHSVPNDILSQLKAQRAKQQKSPETTQTSPISNADQITKSNPQAAVFESATHQAQLDYDSSEKPVALPPKSALDMSVLSELPENIREDYLRQYSRPQHGTTKVSSRTTSMETPKLGLPVKSKPRKVHPAVWARFNKNVTLTQSIFQAPASAEEDELIAAAEKPDPEVLQALPPHIQDEIQRKTKLKEQQARLLLRRRLNQQSARPVGPHYVAFPPRPEKPTFTSAGLTDVADIRNRISQWFDDYKPDGPFEEDTEILCAYLKKVVLVERDMAKAVALVNWVAWVVKNGSADDAAGDDIQRRAQCTAQTVSETRQDASNMSGAELLMTSWAWHKTVRQIKNVVNQAVRERGLGDIELDV
ncbi:deoxycytidyl transferase [Ascosphaera pollenicola]|nr:deoxycytidyl transferase [Ascosphaera pollenicola]